LIAFYGLAFVVGGLKNGWGDLTASFWSHFLSAFGIQLLSLQAIYALVLLELYLTFSKVLAVLTAAVASPILIPLFLQLISYVWKNQLLYSLDFQGNMTIAWVNMPDHYWLKTIIASLIAIAVCLSLAFLSFRKRDL
jgi:ABC-2 type transport system permease protein